MDKIFYSVSEVAEMLDVSLSYAYKVIRKMNEELKAKGYITFVGKISKKFFEEKVYGMH